MKQINIDEKTKEDLIAEFKAYLNKNKFAENSINFSTKINKIPENFKRPTIYITTAAYMKMMLYIRDTSTEIAWHGTVERNLEENYYVIKDVFLYPQKLSAATVQTDQEKYQEWLDSLDDDTFNQLRFQGHSHVNFSPTPSGTDLAYYNDMLQVLPKNDYYIFMIMNKSGDTTFLIYDLAKNIIFETEDIDVKIVSKNVTDYNKHIKEEKDKYCEKPAPVSYKYNSYSEMCNGYPRYGTFDNYGYPKYGTTYIPSKKQDVNDMLDDIDKKWKNPKLSAPKKDSKIKVKGGKR